MKPKLAALAVVVIAFATLNVFRSHASTPHYSGPLLPDAVGSFHLMSHENTASGEVVGTYSDGLTTVLLDVRPYDRDLTHNGARCMLVVGEHPAKEDDHTVATARGTATFDLALFRSGSGTKLVASTECFASGCAENPLTNFSSRAHNQPAITLTNESRTIPISILIDANGTNDGAAAEAVKAFERFAASLDLGHFQAIASQSS